MESADERCTWLPTAELVSRFAASGGPRLPGSRANTNKGVSDCNRDFKVGAILILTVTSAGADSPDTAFVSDDDVPVRIGAVAGTPPATELPADGPNSAIWASSISSICGGGCKLLSVCHRLRAAARSPRTRAANPPYSKAFGLSGACDNASSNNCAAAGVISLPARKLMASPNPSVASTFLASSRRA